jgi:predicted MPP superfamily phosphohydrolase
MPRWSLFLIFLLVAVTVVTSVHYYLYRRLVVAPQLPLPWSVVVRRALVVLGASIPLSFFAIRLLGVQASRYFVCPIYVWLGLMTLFFFTFLALDLIRAGAWAVARVSGHEQLLAAPERKLLLARVAAWTAAAVVLPAAGIGVVRGLGVPQVKPVQVTLPGLPRQLDGFKIAQLTDLHLGPMRSGDWLAQVVAKTNAQKPDLVAITGDLVDGSVADLAADVASLRSLQAPAGVFFVTGNHEYFNDLEGWMQHLPELGVRVLHNQRVSIRRGNAAFDLAGVDDAAGRRFAPGHGTNVPQALSGRDPTRPVVLLAHQPRVIEAAARHGVGLVLSGHTHGGQLWPFTYLVALSQPYLSGLHDHAGTRIYVSQGTGFWGPPMRLGTTAEITLVTLRSPSES